MFQRSLQSAIGLLVFALLVPGFAPAAGTYDPAPVPVNVDRDSLRAAVDEFRDSLFFLDFIMDDRADVEMDAFLVPNGDYAEVEVEWTGLQDAAGQGLLRESTAEEKKEYAMFKKPAWSRVYHTGPGQPVMATGQMRIRVPVRFAQITLQPGDIGTTRRSEDLDGFGAQLLRCENETAAVSVSGRFEESKPVVVFYDEAGGRLATSENATMSSPTVFQMDCRIEGEVASVGVFMPMEYAEEAAEVRASAKPETFGEHAWVIRAPRYLPPVRDAEFGEMDAETLRRTRVEGRRTYAFYGFNEPKLCALLPPRDNCGFAKVEMVELTLFDAAGELIEHELKGGWFDYEDMVRRFDFSGKDDQPVEYSHAAGTVKVRCPAKLKTVTLTGDRPEADGLKASFYGPKVTIEGVELRYDMFAPDRFTVIRGYDAGGHRLRLFNAPIGRGKAACGFWGTPARVEILVPEGWVEAEISFDAPAAPRLPESQQGFKPAGY